MIKGYARKYFEGKTCVFCGKYELYKLADKRVKCKHCKRYYSLNRLRRDLQLLYYVRNENRSLLRDGSILKSFSHFGSSKSLTINPHL